MILKSVYVPTSVLEVLHYFSYQFVRGLYIYLLQAAYFLFFFNADLFLMLLIITKQAVPE